MKMAKKLLAVVLTGVMAVSMLTGCASIETRKVASELEGMLKSVNKDATVSATNEADKLADKAKSAIKDSDTIWAAPQVAVAQPTTALDIAVKNALKDTTDKQDTYVWYTYFATKDVKKTEQAQKIFSKIKEASAAINATGDKAVKNFEVTETSGKVTYEPTTGNKYELGMAEFTHEENGKKVDYVVVVVTCKAVASSEKVS